MDEQSLWYTGENMKRILHSVTSVELENLYKQYVEIQFENKDEEIKKIISQFVRGLDDRIQQIGKN